MRIISINEALNACIANGVKYRVFCDLSGTRRIGYVRKFNEHTCWVKVMKGARTYFVVKRDYSKHRVKLYLDSKRSGFGDSLEHRGKE